MKSLLRSTLEIAQELERLEVASEREPPHDPERLQAELDLALPVEGIGEAELAELLRAVVAVTPHTSGRRFFNQLFGGREPAAGAAEMLAGLLNNSMYTFKAAGVHVLIEREVTQRLAEAAGWPEGEGTTVPGGSLGNLAALVMARNEAIPEAREHGTGDSQPTVYLSEDGHYSVRKSAGMIGIGRAQVRQIPVDQRGRMRPEDLAERLDDDVRSGAAPVCVVATAGTTVAGAFDPLREIAAITRPRGIWLHVDGALGASLLLHPQLRHRLDGVELADSLSWNAHKMMGVPLPSAFLLVPRSGTLQKHFDEAADYLFQQDSADLNLGTRSIQCGRRNDVLKVWAAWQALGDRGWERRLERQMELAAFAVAEIRRRPGFVLALEPECINVCFEVAGVSSKQICEHLQRSGAASIGYGTVRVAGERRQVIRLVTVNPEVTRAELDRLFDDVASAAAQVLTLAEARTTEA